MVLICVFFNSYFLDQEVCLLFYFPLRRSRRNFIGQNEYEGRYYCTDVIAILIYFYLHVSLSNLQQSCLLLILSINLLTWIDFTETSIFIISDFYLLPF